MQPSIYPLHYLLKECRVAVKSKADYQLPVLPECLHQCKRCGTVFDCEAGTCGQPFESGYCKICASPAAIAMNFVPMAN
jgi:hypothetical protein